MKVFRDEATGYLVIDEIEEGFEILPTSLYQGYLKQIEDLKKDNKDLRSKLDYMSLKLADALSAQAEAENKRAEAESKRESNNALTLERISSMVETERMMGAIRGWICARNGWRPEFTELIFEEFDMWYAEALDNGTIDALDAKANRRIAEKKRRRLQDHSDSQ